MIEHAAPTPTPPSGPLAMVTTMGLVGLLSSVLLVGTYQVTLPYIEANRAAYLERTIFEVLPGAVEKRTFVRQGDRLVPDEDESVRAVRIYAGYDEVGALVGVAIPASGQGFVDVLHILYGYDPGCECVVGMQVLESKETPGLGDKIETDARYVRQFEALDVRLDPAGRGLLNPLRPAKPGTGAETWQVETITGATVTSRAVVEIINRSSNELIPLIRNNMNMLAP
jgi:Na+-translocating ferredoxin:NAD+ oxidoreductase subunit G